MAYNDLPMGDKKIAQMISEGNTETSAAIASFLDKTPANLPDKGEAFYSHKTLKYEDFTAAIAGDSTGNATDEWADLYMSSVATANPDLTVEVPHWNDTTQTYNAATVIQTGTSTPPGITFSDTFTRTSADLYATQPDIGPVWGRDGTLAAGDWSVDGSKAVRTSDATASSMLADGQSAGDMRVSFNGTLSTINGGGSTRQFRIYANYLSSNNHIYAQISVTTAGTSSVSINKRINNVATAIFSGGTGILTASTASVPYTLSFERSGTDVQLTINGTTYNATLTQEEVDAISSGTLAGFSGGVATGDWIDNFKIESLTTSTPVKLTFYNASMSGSKLDYQQSRLATLYPASTKIDLLFISSCHNYGGLSPEEYLALVDSFIKDYRAIHPESGIIISSQNPQKAPAVNKTAHLTRLGALRSYAATHGYGYLPVIEAFKASAGGGLSLINSDGIHPTPGATNSGSSLWRDTVVSYFNNF